MRYSQFFLLIRIKLLCSAFFRSYLYRVHLLDLDNMFPCLLLSNVPRSRQSAASRNQARGIRHQELLSLDIWYHVIHRVRKSQDPRGSSIPCSGQRELMHAAVIYDDRVMALGITDCLNHLGFFPIS